MSMRPSTILNRESSIALLASSICAIVPSAAQEILPSVPAPQPPPPASATPPNPPSFYAASGPSATSQIGVPAFAANAEMTAKALLENPLRWGPFTAHPHIADTFTYGTGLTAGTGLGNAPTALETLAPGILIQSKHLSLDYTPSLAYYIKGPYKDSVNQHASLDAAFGYGDWHFGILQGFDKSSNPLVETGQQTEIESFSTTLTASYFYSQKISLDFSVSQQISNTSEAEQQINPGFTLGNYRQWSTMNWANYHWSDKTSFGFGAGGGYVDVETGTDSTYEQVQGRVDWRPGQKLSAGINGGVEIRQFLGSAAGPGRVNPLMGATVGYQLFDATSIALTANRSVDTSIFQNQTTESTSFSGSLNQRLLKHFFLGLSAGYHLMDYVASADTLAGPARTDSQTFVQTSLGTHFFKKASASVSYQHSKNSSTFEGFNYDSDQYTVQIGYSF